MSIYEGITNVVSNYQTAEYGKFLQLTSSDFPAISVTRVEYPDRSQAFPENTFAAPLTTTDIYPKYAILSHITNPSDISQVVNISGSNVAINLAPLTATNATLASLLANNQALLAQETQSFIALSAIDLNTFDTITAVNMFNQSFNQAITSLEVSIKEPTGTYYSIDSFDVYGTGGFDFTNAERPMFALRVKPNSTRSIIIDEYSIINTDTAHICGYRWYLNPILSATTNWGDLTTDIQYCFLSGSPTSSTIQGALSTIKHSGVFAGKNAANDEGASVITLSGGATPPVLVLALQHLNGSSGAGAFLAVGIKDLG